MNLLVVFLVAVLMIVTGHESINTETADIAKQEIVAAVATDILESEK
ncbi:MAG: hypothetical protein AAFY76_20080 [Cyanobacteria bacterium J06649_11]